MIPYVIAELGSNPCDTTSFDRPMWHVGPYCRAAKGAGASAVKIQLWKYSHFPKGEWESKRALEFPRWQVEEFAHAAKHFGLECGASVFDEEAVALAAKHLDFLKLAAREQFEMQLLADTLKMAEYKGIPLYRSMSHGGRPVDWHGKTKFVNLYTISEYPTPLWYAVLHLIQVPRLYEKQKIKDWGWSSHTRSIWDCVLAAKLGASVIEKHLKLSESDVEAGHSLSVKDFARMVRWCR